MGGNSQSTLGYPTAFTYIGSIQKINELRLKDREELREELRQNKRPTTSRFPFRRSTRRIRIYDDSNSEQMIHTCFDTPENKNRATTELFQVQNSQRRKQAKAKQNSFDSPICKRSSLEVEDPYGNKKFNQTFYYNMFMTKDKESKYKLIDGEIDEERENVLQDDSEEEGNTVYIAKGNSTLKSKTALLHDVFPSDIELGIKSGIKSDKSKADTKKKSNLAEDNIPGPSNGLQTKEKIPESLSIESFRSEELEFNEISINCMPCHSKESHGSENVFVSSKVQQKTSSESKGETNFNTDTKRLGKDSLDKAKSEKCFRIDEGY